MARSEAREEPPAPARARQAAGRDRGKPERLVTAARQVLYEQGVEKSALAVIVEAADVRLGNVYYYFKTRTPWRPRLSRTTGSPSANLRARLEQGAEPIARLNALLGWLTARQERLASYGSPVGSLAAELAKRDRGLRAGAAILAGWANWAETQFRTMGREDGRELAMALIGTETSRLGRWIDSVAQSQPSRGTSQPAGIPVRSPSRPR